MAEHPTDDAVARHGLPLTPSYETGVFLGIGALPDAILVMNSPWCGFVRSMKVALGHDLCGSLYRSDGLHRIATSEWMVVEDVMGAEDRFRRALERAAEDGRFRFVFGYQNISSLVSGFDLEGVCREAASGSAHAILPVSGPRLDGDWLDGYRAVVAPVERLVRLDPEDGEGVAVVGGLFTRNEWDDLGNVAEMRRLMAALAADPVVVVPEGAPLDLEGPRRAILALPYATGGAPEGSVPVPLPVGIEGTVGWLRAAAEVLGQTETAEALIAAELAELDALLRWPVLDGLTGRSAVVVADPVLGPALCAFLREIGMSVAAWFSTSRRAAEVAGVEVVADASVESAVPIVAGIRAREDIDVVVGADLLGAVPGLDDLPRVTVGFPAYGAHAFHPAPYYGFAGVRRLVSDLLNALRR